MSENNVRITTGEAAEIVHVHESSIKRWCDAGDLDFALTPGGHRRVMLGSLLQYANAQGLESELLQFGADAEFVYQVLEQFKRDRFAPAVSMLFRDLREGSGERLGSFLSMLIREGQPLERVLDEVVAPVLRRVGAGWSTGSISIGEEHRISELMSDALYELRSNLEAKSPIGRSVVVGSYEGNRHELGANMTRMVLENEGWNVVYLGGDVPVHEFVLQQQATESELVCISLSPPQVASDAMRLLHVLDGLYRDGSHYRLAIGGEPVRQLDPSDFDGYSFVDCRGFYNLTAFADWL